MSCLVIGPSGLIRAIWATFDNNGEPIKIPGKGPWYQSSCNTCRPLQGVEAFTDGSNTKRATLELQLRDKAGPNTIAGELPNASIEPCAGKSLFCLDSITYGQVIWPNAKFINV